MPAVLDPSGMTLDEAEVTAIAVTLFKYKMRPGKLAAAGKVTVQAVVENRIDTSVVATVYVAAIVRVGVERARVVNAPLAGVVAPTVPLNAPANPVADKTPVEGTNDNLVLVVF